MSNRHLIVVLGTAILAILLALPLAASAKGPRDCAHAGCAPSWSHDGCRGDRFCGATGRPRGGDPSYPTRRGDVDRGYQGFQGNHAIRGYAPPFPTDGGSRGRTNSSRGGLR